MSDGTKIEWTDATVNAINGCSVVSPGCKHCYAMKQAHRFPARQGLTTMTAGGMVWTGEVRFNEKLLLAPLAWKKPRMLFWNAHGDMFHADVPVIWIDRCYAVMALTHQHKHQVLTKRSERMRDYANDPRTPERIARIILDEADEWGVSGAKSLTALGNRATEEDPSFVPWPLANVWMGVSVEDQKRADERIPDLLATPAAVRWLSCEPLLGPVDLRGYAKIHGQGRRSWSTWGWPSWVPSKVRESVESFWRAEYGRGPDAWIRGAINNGQPPLGTRGEFRLCRAGIHMVKGRFVPAWNNIGWVVDDEGAVHTVSDGVYQGKPPYIDWVVPGGESGPGARPLHPDWVRSLRDQCAAAGVPFLFKQWGEHSLDYDRDRDDPDWRQCSSIADQRGQWINLAGGHGFHGDRVHYAARVGKKAAGRLLDGVEHNGYPS